MAATTKRHPSRTRLRTAVSRDGKLLAGTIDIALDGGAYATLSPVVLSRATIHAPGPYKWPALRVRSKAMATNIPPHGAFRGFGAPQSLFALERHMDKIARTLNLSPEEFRRRNFLSTGDTTATGQLLHEPVDMQHLLTRALADADYHAQARPLRRLQPHLPNQTRHRLRGLHARHRLHRLRRAPPQLASPPRHPSRRPPPDPRLLNRIRPGHQHHPLPGSRRNPRPPLRRHPHPRSRHRRSPQLRPDGSQPHRDDRRQASRTRSPRNPNHPPQRSRTSPRPTPASNSSPPQSPTSRTTPNSEPPSATSPPQKSSGTTTSTAATPIPATPGPSTSPK